MRNDAESNAREPHATLASTSAVHIPRGGRSGRYGTSQRVVRADLEPVAPQPRPRRRVRRCHDDFRPFNRIYQMDFDIEDDKAKDRIVGHVAERALAAYDAAKLRELVSEAN